MKFYSAILIASTSLFAVSHVRATALERASPSPIHPIPHFADGDVKKVALGRDLYFEPRLSRSMRLSCSSCHDLTTNGASNAHIDRDDAGQKMTFNTPTIFNSIYSFRFGWRGQRRTAQDIIAADLAGETMAGAHLAASRLSADERWRKRFISIYGSAPNDANIVDALTTFVGTLITPDAPFDRWLAGDAKALTAQQFRGYSRFKSVGCSGCHQGVDVGANLFQPSGVFHRINTKTNILLRVPSLRNVAVTPPYFHDGSITTLPEAVRKMASAQLDVALDERDIADITAFLGSLTGRYRGHRLRPSRNMPQ
jgi:cytochrome c peroxidase